MAKRVFYPKRLGEAETTSAMLHKGRDIYDGYFYDADGNARLGTLIEQKAVKLNKATTELNGAFPYTFDFLSYVCTNAKQAIENTEPSNRNYYYSVTAPWSKYLELTLGRYTDQKHSLLTELIAIEGNNAPIKVVPWDETTSIKGSPIRVAFRGVNKAALAPGVVKRLNNLDHVSNMPIGEIQIEFLKPLFQDVIENKGNSFPLPAAFHATMKDDMEKCRNDKDIKAIPEANYPQTYRKLWIYLNLHDNGEGAKIIVPAVDLLMHCAPQYIQEKPDGSRYVKDWWKARLFVIKGLTLFRKMAEYGHMGPCKFSPTGVFYNKPLRTFDITVTRNKTEYKTVINDLDQSPFKNLPYTAEPPKEIATPDF